MNPSVERFRSGLSERLRSIDRATLSRPTRMLREAMGSAIGRVISSPTTIRVLAGTAFLVSTAAGLNEMLPDLQIASDYLQLAEPNLSLFEASARVLASDDPNADMARRLMLQVNGVEALETYESLAKMGVKTPPGIDPMIQAIRPDIARQIFYRHAFDGGPALMGALISGATLLLTSWIHSGRKGPESEYTPEYAQIQRRYDLDNLDMVGQVEALLAGNPTKTYHMEQTYFEPKGCEQVMTQLFRCPDRNQRKQALNSVGLSEGAEIDAKESRVVTIDGSPSIVLRIKRGDQGTFGKETYYADQGYPPILGVALSMLAPHTDLTTVKIRTVLQRRVSYKDPETGREGTTEAILNYDQYPNPTAPNEILHRRAEIVVPAMAGVKPEEVFPEFSQVLGQLGESELNDKKIGLEIKQGNA